MSLSRSEAAAELRKERFGNSHSRTWGRVKLRLQGGCGSFSVCLTVPSAKARLLADAYERGQEYKCIVTDPDGAVIFIPVEAIRLARGLCDCGGGHHAETCPYAGLAVDGAGETQQRTDVSLLVVDGMVELHVAGKLDTNYGYGVTLGQIHERLVALAVSSGGATQAEQKEKPLSSDTPFEKPKMQEIGKVEPE